MKIDQNKYKSLVLGRQADRQEHTERRSNMKITAKKDFYEFTFILTYNNNNNKILWLFHHSLY